MRIEEIYSMHSQLKVVAGSRCIKILRPLREMDKFTLRKIDGRGKKDNFLVNNRDYLCNGTYPLGNIYDSHGNKTSGQGNEDNPFVHNRDFLRPQHYSLGNIYDPSGKNVSVEGKMVVGQWILSRNLKPETCNVQQIKQKINKVSIFFRFYGVHGGSITNNIKLIAYET